MQCPKCKRSDGVHAYGCSEARTSREREQQSEIQVKDARIQELTACLMSVEELSKSREEEIEALKKEIATINQVRTNEQLIERIQALKAEVERLQSSLSVAQEEIEKLQVQLAGCGVAALGCTSPETICTQDQWGWSQSYQDVLDLRLKYDALQSRERELVEGLRNIRLFLVQHICNVHNHVTPELFADVCVACRLQVNLNKISALIEEKGKI
jgi:predicted  nucleic acid-binding Zn-ribbon protein